MSDEANRISSNTMVMTSLMTSVLASAALFAGALALQTSTAVSIKTAKDRAATTQTVKKPTEVTVDTGGYTKDYAPLTFTILAEASNDISKDAKRLLQMQLAERFQNAASKTTMAELLTPEGKSAFAQKVCRDQIEGAAAYTGVSCTIGPIRKF